MEVNKQWILFTFVRAFGIYWVLSLILWFPWSISVALGMTLMLTLSPLILSAGVFQSLKRYQGQGLVKGAILTSLIYTLVSVVSDVIFFGFIRNAWKDLYHPTTFYGYLFMICLPFILVLIFPKQLSKKRRDFKEGFHKVYRNRTC